MSGKILAHLVAAGLLLNSLPVYAQSSAPLGTNLAANASFETPDSEGLLPEGWSLARASQLDPAPILYPDATSPEWAGDPGARTGDRHLKFVVSTPSDLSASETTLFYLDSLIPVKTDTDYRLEFSYRFEEVDERAKGTSRFTFGLTRFYDANPGGTPDPQEIVPAIPGDWVGSACCGYPPAETTQWSRVQQDIRIDSSGYVVDGTVRQVAWVRLGISPNEHFQGTVAADDVSFIELASAVLDPPENSMAYDFVSRKCDYNSVNSGSICVSDSDCPGKDTNDDQIVDTVGACLTGATPGFVPTPFNRQFSGEGGGQYGFDFDDVSNPPTLYDQSSYPNRFSGTYMARNAKFRVALDPGSYRVSLFMGGLWRNSPLSELHIVDFNGENRISEYGDWIDGYQPGDPIDTAAVNEDVMDHWYFKNMEATLVTSDDVANDRRGYAVYDNYVAPRYRRHDLDVTIDDEGDFANLLEIKNRSGFMTGVIITPIADQAEHDAAVEAFEATLADEFVTHFANYRAPEDFGLPTVQGDYAPTSEDEDRGYVIFKRHWMDFVEFNSRPDFGELPVSGLSVAATPGEFEPVAFSIWAQQQLENATVTVSDLQTAGGEETISGEAVGVWYLQHKPRRDGTTFSFVGVYLPDWGASRTLYPDMTQRAWLNVKVPEEAAPGLYEGEVTFSADGVESTVLPLTLEVRAFRLQRPPHVRSLRGAGGSKLILGYPSSDPDVPGDEDPPIHNREYYRKAAYQDLYDHGFTPDITPHFGGPLVSGSSCFWDSNGDFVWSCGTIGGSGDDQLDRFDASPLGSGDTMWIDGTFSRVIKAFEGNPAAEWSPADVARWLADVEGKLHGERGMNTIYMHATSEESHYEGSAWTDYLDFVRTYRETGYAGSGPWSHVYSTHTSNTISGQPEAIDHADFPFLGMFHGVTVPLPSDQIAAAKASGKPFGIYGIRGRFVAGFYHWKSGATGSFHEFYDLYSGTLNDDWDTPDGDMGENPGWTNALYSQSGRMVGNWHWEEMREGVDDDAYLATLDYWIGRYGCEENPGGACTDALVARQVISDAIDLDGSASPADPEDAVTGGRYSRSGLNLTRPIAPAALDALRSQAAEAIEALLGPDADSDWTPDQVDNCPDVANPNQEDADQNGTGDACNSAEDADGDDWADGLDNCPAIANPGQEDADQNGTGDACNSAEDGDGDDWADGLDNCPANANPGQEDADQNGTGDACNSAEDADGDGWADEFDNCPAIANPGQEDADQNGTGDACNSAEDADGDGWADGFDNCPAIANSGQEDADQNGTGDACNSAEDADGDDWADGLDNCPAIANSGQEDLDGDDDGDVCDLDRDGDGVSNTGDNCADVANPNQEDVDQNGTGDACNSSEDADADDFADGLDNCPAIANSGQEDLDGDDEGDACDLDRDGDGLWNTGDNCADVANPNQDDTDSNGTGDACNSDEDTDGDDWADSLDNCLEIANPSQEDANFDGFGNYCDADFNDDGVIDPQDAILWTNAYETTIEDEGYESAMDLRPNGTINIQDFLLYSAQYAWGFPGASGLACAGAAPGDADYPCRSRSDDADGDGISDSSDNCPNVWNLPQIDICTDTDEDGLIDRNDNCPTHSNPDQMDTDGDSEGNACDVDDDGDGLDDSVETGTGIFVDETDTGTDPLKPDSDDDGVNDGVETLFGTDPNSFDATAVPFLSPLATAGLAVLMLGGALGVLRKRR